MKFPYGYVLVDEEIAIHEERADVVRSIFVYYPCLTYFIILDRKKPEFFVYFPIVALV